MELTQKRLIGLVGGMSWHSTAIYYRIINTYANERLNGLHNAKSVLATLDFAEIATLSKREDFPALLKLLAGAVQTLERAGADFFALLANTMHFDTESLGSMVSLPILHIVDAVGQTLSRERIEKVALLGTAITMEKPFYADKLLEDYGIETIVPDAKGREVVSEIIYSELTLGTVKGQSTASVVSILGQLKERGAQGVILGCTELGLMLNEGNSPLPVYDSAELHAKAIVDHAIM